MILASRARNAAAETRSPSEIRRVSVCCTVAEIRRGDAVDRIAQAPAASCCIGLVRLAWSIAAIRSWATVGSPSRDPRKTQGTTADSTHAPMSLITGYRQSSGSRRLATAPGAPRALRSLLLAASRPKVSADPRPGAGLHLASRARASACRAVGRHADPCVAWQAIPPTSHQWMSWLARTKGFEPPTLSSED